VQLARAEIGLYLARPKALRETIGAAVPEERWAAAGRKLAVEEHRQAELADPLGQLQGGCFRPLHIGRTKRDDWHHVSRSDPGMRALVATQVDSVSSTANGVDQRTDQRLVLTHDRENRSVVVGIRVHVEEAHLGERCADRIDDGPVAPLGEVRHRLEGQHSPTLGAVKAYYEARAREYDDWWHWHVDEHPDEFAALVGVVEALPPVRTLDVACGTGFLTRHLSGEVVGIDQSPTALEIAARQAPDAELLQGEGLELPFADGSFDRVFTSHFYGHLNPHERTQFLTEARRLGPELVVVDSAIRSDRPETLMQERILKDGSQWAVLKRYFTGASLLTELGGGDVIHEGEYFVVVRT